MPECNGNTPPIFTLTGQAVHGKHLGTRLGFPTANLTYEAEPMVKDGVYIALARIDNEPRIYAAILNQGKHPTAPKGKPTIEVHLLGYDGGELYGRELTLWYRQYLRAEEKFPTLDTLKDQLARDRAVALEWARTNGI